MNASFHQLRRRLAGSGLLTAALLSGELSGCATSGIGRGAGTPRQFPAAQTSEAARAPEQPSNAADLAASTPPPRNGDVESDTPETALPAANESADTVEPTPAELVAGTSVPSESPPQPPRDSDDPVPRSSDEPSPSAASRAMSQAARLVQEGHRPGARLMLLVAARESPNDPDLCVAVARIDESLGYWREAAEWYAAATKSAGAEDDPAAVRWDRQRARCLYRGGDYKAAHDLWSECLDPEDRGTALAELTEYADACLQISDYEAAQIVLDHLSNRSAGRLKDVELLRAACALRRGDPDSAEEIAAAAIEGWPDDERLRRVLDLARESSREAGDAPQKAGPPEDEIPARELPVIDQVNGETEAPQVEEVEIPITDEAPTSPE